MHSEFNQGVSYCSIVLFENLSGLFVVADFLDALSLQVP